MIELSLFDEHQVAEDVVRDEDALLGQADVPVIFHQFSAFQIPHNVRNPVITYSL